MKLSETVVKIKPEEINRKVINFQQLLNMFIDLLIITKNILIIVLNQQQRTTFFEGREMVKTLKNIGYTF